MAAEPTAVLVVRAWREQTAGGAALRARITQTLDVSSGETTHAIVGSEADVLAVVERWLQALLTQP